MRYQPAPFLRRLTARVIDLVFALVVTFVIALPMAVVVALVTPLLGRGLWWGIAAAICYFLAYVGLEVFLLVRRGGQTLGKGLMGLRVVLAGAANSDQLAIGPVTVRMLLILAPFVLLAIAGSAAQDGQPSQLAGIAMLALLINLVLAAIPTRRRQALHDLAAGTRVVIAPKRTIQWRQDVRMMVPGKVDMTKRL